jgi:integrase
MAAALRETGVLPDDRMTLSGWLDEWYAAATPRLRPSSRRTYALAVAKLDAVLGGCRVATLRPSTIEAGLAAMPAPTARLARHVLSAAMSAAERDGLVTRNPVRLVRVAPAVPTFARVPTVDEVRCLLSATSGRDGAILAVGLSTGLRPGEICGLHWEDVRGDQVDIRRQAVRVAGGWEYGELKTPMSRRTIELPPVAALALAAWRSEAAAIAGPMFRIMPPGLRHVVEEACRAAGVEPFPPHSMRRFAATVLSVDPKGAAAALGHASARVTLDVYARTATDFRHRAATAMQEAIG